MQGNLAHATLEYFGDDGTIPNSRLPVVIYARAIEPGDVSPEALEALFDTNGWPSAWRATIFDFQHYHSNAHECLGVAAGSARLQLGGAQGRTFDVRAGDVIVLPAGVGHKKLSASEDFLVVGAYPPGITQDLMKGETGERPNADERIAQVPLPKTDPVGGQGGIVLERWS